ncbi:uncharacterized protein LOC123200910 [Mangifera indica]|uniref:uncharacterized protein LOC123200910 n=1 Tax=Mangifera indica TaxID=29780 RepID=UPI001CFB3C71|nr:uncharacterized protein LOC123200910 [Mangifera indica]
MVELQPYCSFEDVCKLAIKVEKQKKVMKHTISKTTFHKESLSYKSLTLREIQAIEDSFQEEEEENKAPSPELTESNDEEKEVIQGANEGEMMVIRRNWHVKNLPHEEQRFNIFQSRYTINGKEENEPSPLVQPVLTIFEYISPNELPPSLSPPRCIKHQIDLILTAPLPNKPAYRCNLKKTKELQRQVNEFIEKGYMRPSMNPCLKLALLVPRKDGTYKMCVDSK